MDVLVFPKFFHPALDAGRLAETALELGFDGIDIIIREGQSWCQDSDFLDSVPAFCEVVRGAGLKAYSASTDWTHEEVPRLDEAYRLFQDNGILMFRFWLQRYQGPGSFRNDHARCLRTMDIIEKFGQRYRVKALLQTHGWNMTWSPEAAYDMVKGFDPAAIGVHYDPGNMIAQEGFTLPEKAVDLLGEYLSYVGVKNAGWFCAPDSAKGQSLTWRPAWTHLAEGIVDWRAVLDALCKAQYKGPLCMHNFYENGLDGLIAATAGDMAYLRGLLEELSC